MGMQIYDKFPISNDMVVDFQYPYGMKYNIVGYKKILYYNFKSLFIRQFVFSSFVYYFRKSYVISYPPFIIRPNKVEIGQLVPFMGKIFFAYAKKTIMETKQRKYEVCYCLSPLNSRTYVRFCSQAKKEFYRIWIEYIKKGKKKKNTNE